jgi:hypothetical protein
MELPRKANETANSIYELVGELELHHNFLYSNALSRTVPDGLLVIEPR